MRFFQSFGWNGHTLPLDFESPPCIPISQLRQISARMEITSRRCRLEHARPEPIIIHPCKTQSMSTCCICLGSTPKMRAVLVYQTARQVSTAGRRRLNGRGISLCTFLPPTRESSRRGLGPTPQPWAFFFFSGVRFQPLMTRYGSPTATPSTASTAKKLPTSP